MDKKKKRKKVIRWVVTAIVAVIVIFFGFWVATRIQNNAKNADSTIIRTTSVVTRGNLSKTLGVTSSINPSEYIEHFAGNQGEVIEVIFNEGDYVDEGMVVVKLDTEATEETVSAIIDQIDQKQEQIANLYDIIDDTNASIEDSYEYIADSNDDLLVLEDELADLQKDLADNETSRGSLNVYAPISGTIMSVAREPGDTVVEGTVIANITNTLSYHVEIPFRSEIYDKSIEEVYVSYLNTQIPAEVVRVTDYIYENQNYHEMVNVILSFTTDSAIAQDATVKGKAVTDDGETYTSQGAVPYFSETFDIEAYVPGEILQISIFEKQYVLQGSLIAVIGSDQLDDIAEVLVSQINDKLEQIEDLNDSIANTYENIENMNENITGFNDDITDLLLDKTELEEDKLEAEEGYIRAEVSAENSGIIYNLTVSVGNEVGYNQKLFTVISLENPEMELSIDELDIMNISTGLPVEVEIDALPDTVGNPVKAAVTEISYVGNAQGGVTTFPVTIQLEGTIDNLRFGMNGTATVFVSSSDNTLILPIEAVTILNGKSFVWVTDTESPGNKSIYDKSAYTDKKVNYDKSGAIQQTGGKTADKNANIDSKTLVKNATDTPVTLEDYYTGATMVQVTTGINNETQIEILDGLTEGQIVLLPPIYQSNISDTAASGAFNMGTARKAIGGIGK